MYRTGHVRRARKRDCQPGSPRTNVRPRTDRRGASTSPDARSEHAPHSDKSSRSRQLRQTADDRPRPRGPCCEGELTPHARNPFIRAAARPVGEAPGAAARDRPRAGSPRSRVRGSRRDPDRRPDRRPDRGPDWSPDQCPDGPGCGTAGRAGPGPGSDPGPGRGRSRTVHPQQAVRQATARGPGRRRLRSRRARVDRQDRSPVGRHVRRPPERLERRCAARRRDRHRRLPGVGHHGRRVR